MKTFAFSILLLFSSLHSEWANTSDQGPVHEAFISKVTSQPLLQAITQRPPEAIIERIPAQPDSDTTWIGGYWMWNEAAQDFVWVCGVWRRPPPHHQWIPGFWSQETEGWVWFPGFWSEDAKHELTYIDKAPPDPVNEQVGKAPKKNFFWVQGYWQWDPSADSYHWLSGKWEPLDKRWVLVPAHYMWREHGYIFVPAYWDLPIESRGLAFSCVDIPENVREDYVYMPDARLTPEMIVERLFCCYPDYIYLYCHHWHFHQDWWIGQPWCPPWWGWDAWWTFPWHDHWGLWWWWSHADFPVPIWLTIDFTALINAPPENLIEMMEDLIGPLFITKKGVVPPEDLIDALGDNMPIIPPDSKEIQEDLERKVTPPEKPLKPSGEADSLEENIDNQKPKPRDSIEKVPGKDHGGTQVVPEAPSWRLPGQKPPQTNIRVPSRPIMPPSQVAPRAPQYRPPQQQRPQRTPKPYYPPQRQPERYYPPQQRTPQPYYPPQRQPQRPPQQSYPPQRQPQRPPQQSYPPQQRPQRPPSWHQPTRPPQLIPPVQHQKPQQSRPRETPQSPKGEFY